MEKTAGFGIFVLVTETCSKKLTTALAAVILLFCTVDCPAQALVGLFNSPKGFGIQADFAARSSQEFNRVVLYADTYGVLLDRTETPGVILNYSHEFFLTRIEKGYSVFSLYAGAGITTGYVHDFERGVASLYGRLLTKGPGVVGAISGDCGIRADLGSRLLLDLSFRMDLGMFARRDESNASLLMSFYKNGAFHSYYPQLSILYSF